MIVLIPLAFLAAAVTFAALGWLLGRPDSSGRFRDRFVALLMAACAAAMWAAIRITEHSWVWAAIDALGAVFWAAAVPGAWDKWESWRRERRSSSKGCGK